MSKGALRKFCNLCMVIDAIYAVAGVVWQSTDAHRVSVMQLVVNDSFWWVVLMVCILKFSVPKWVIALFAIGIMGTLSLWIERGIDRSVAEVASIVVYVIVATINLGFFLAWWRLATKANATRLSIREDNAV